MAKVTAKTATRRKAAAKKPVRKTAKKAAAKRAPAKKAAKTAVPAYPEHPEGMFARLTSLRDEMDNLFDSLTRSFGLPELRMPSIELPSRAGIA